MDAIPHACVIPDAKVPASLYDQAIGDEFTCTELKPDNDSGEFERYAVPQNIPKNINANRFGLINRQPLK